MIYFEIKAKHDKLNQQTGKVSTVNRQYLLDAVSYTDAESKITKYLTDEEKINEFDLIINKTLIEEAIESKKDLWYYVEIATIDFNEITGKEKQYVSRLMINSDTLAECKNKIVILFKDTGIDYVIKTIKETKIEKYIKSK